MSINFLGAIEENLFALWKGWDMKIKLHCIVEASRNKTVFHINPILTYHKQKVFFLDFWKDLTILYVFSPLLCVSIEWNYWFKHQFQFRISKLSTKNRIDRVLNYLAFKTCSSDWKIKDKSHTHTLLHVWFVARQTEQ